MQETVYSRALRRAAQTLGGVEALRAHLQVSMTLLQRWIQGETLPPEAVFLKVVDLLSENELAEIRRGKRDQNSQA